MSQWRETLKSVWAWMQDNVKTVLLLANVLVVLFLIYTLGAQALFVVRTNRLLSEASAVAPKPSPAGAKTPASRERGASDARSDRRQGSRPNRRGSSAERATSATVTTTSVAAATSATAATTTGSVADAATTGALVTTVQALTTGTQPTTATVAISTDTAPMTTGTVAASATAISSAPIAAEATSDTTPSSASIALQLAVRWASNRLKSIQQLANSGGGRTEERSGTRGGDRGSSNSRSGKGSETQKSAEDKKKELFAKLEQRSLFGGARPTVQQPQLEAILGDKALITGQWLEVGGKFNDSKVVAIETDRVVLEDEDGKRRDLTFGGMGGSGGPSGGPAVASRSGSSSGARGAPGSPGSTSASPTEGPGGISINPMSFRNMSRDELYERLTGPGGPLQGMSREQFEERARQFMEGRRGGELRRGRGRTE